MSAREVIIQMVGARGDGIAAGPVFVPLTLPGERVTAAFEGDRGELEAVLEPSADRQAPLCPHFGVCGGCAVQHWRHAPYLAWKVEQIRLALARERIETQFLAPFAAPPGSRRRLSLHARKAGKGAQIGFKQRRSWTLAPIDVCVIADPRIVAAFPALRELAAGLFEHRKSAPILHVTWTATGLDVDITGVEGSNGGLSADARMTAAMAAGAGDFARVTLNGEVIYGARSPIVVIGQARVVLPPGGFLQAVPAAEAAMAELVVEHLAGAASIADLYSGVGTFAFRLAAASKVWAYDSAAPAVAAMKSAQATAPGLKAITGEARDLARRPVTSAELSRLDAAVLDPPRAGALEQAGEIARSNLARVAYVSCNPATFARDARLLADAGFVLKTVKPIDQFLWSPHVELVGLFER